MGQDRAKLKEGGKDMGSFDKVPLTGGKSYYNKRVMRSLENQAFFIVGF
jgi:hypothetical protein